MFRNIRHGTGHPARSSGMAAAGFALSVTLAACSLGGSSGSGDTSAPAGADGITSGATEGGSEGAAPTGSGEVVLVTHESWAAPEGLLEEFTEQTGYTVTVQPSGDAGEVTNKLVLTKNSPIGDVVFGIDNTFATRAVNEGVLTAYTPSDLPAGVADHALPGEAAQFLTPIDYGDVCVNIDDAWFAEHDVAPPETLQDLTEPEYEDLFVTPGATTSSPGMAFLLATIGEFGPDGWQDYWQQLMDNGTRITSGWSDAYSVDFTAGEGSGDRPIVLSYASSPPFTIPEGGDEPTTSALLDTCFRQTEYAGVIEGAANPEGAQALVDFLVSDAFQETIADNMYMFPASSQVELPEVWAKWADVADEPIEVDPADVEQHRDEWLRQWGEITSR